MLATWPPWSIFCLIPIFLPRFRQIDPFCGNNAFSWERNKQALLRSVLQLKKRNKDDDKEDKDSVKDKRQRGQRQCQRQKTKTGSMVTKNTYKDKIETRTLFSSGLQLKTRSKWSLGFSDYSSSGSDIEISHSIPFKIKISHFIKVHRKKREIIKTLQNWRRHSSKAWYGHRFSPFTFTNSTPGHCRRSKRKRWFSMKRGEKDGNLINCEAG